MMSTLEILLLAVALAVDAFTVGAGVALKHRRPRQIFRLSFHFGLFQSLMALLGVLGGVVLLELIVAWDHWLAFALLALVGGRMITGVGDGAGAGRRSDPTRGGSLVGLSLAVSLDALAAGIGLAAAHAPRVTAILLIGLVSGLATWLAFAVAGRLGRWVDRYGERLAGLVLIGLGVKILVEHLLLGP